MCFYSLSNTRHVQRKMLGFILIFRLFQKTFYEWGILSKVRTFHIDKAIEYVDIWLAQR